MRLCVSAVVCLLHASALAAPDRSHLSSDPRVQEARTLVQNGRFDEALTVLRPLVSTHSDRTDVLFLVGLAAIEAARARGETAERDALLAEAVTALRAILVDRPDLVRVRLELARAFFLQGEDSLSREHFERVLAGEPPAAMAVNIRRFLEVIRARRRWSGYFGAAIAPDSNINAASDTKTIHIHGLPFRLDNDSGARSGVGVVVWGGGEYQHPSSSSLRMRIGADITRLEYAGGNFDRTLVSGHAGPRWLVDRDTEASLLASLRRRSAGGAPSSHDLGARLEVGRRFTRRLTMRGKASWHWREYRRSVDPLDGPILDLMLGAVWLATPTVRTDAAVGYTRERPKTLMRRNSGRWARIGVSAALPLGITLEVGGALRWTEYEGRWSPFTPGGTAREDRTRTLHASAFHRALTILGFSPQLTLVNEARRSSAQLHDYKRNRVELRFVKQF